MLSPILSRNLFGIVHLVLLLSSIGVEDEHALVSLRLCFELIISGEGVALEFDLLEFLVTICHGVCEPEVEGDTESDFANKLTPKFLFAGLFCNMKRACLLL